MTVEIQNIIQDFAAETRELLKDNLIEEYLFGSYSKKTQSPLSDIDILIIVKTFTSQIRSQLSALSSQYSLNTGIIISPIVKDVRIWGKNKKYNTFFYKEIEKHGIKL